MQYHWRILRQQGHGLGGLLRLAAPVMKNVMTGLVGGVSGGGGPWSPPYYPSSRNYYPPPPPLPSYEYICIHQKEAHRHADAVVEGTQDHRKEKEFLQIY